MKRTAAWIAGGWLLLAAFAGLAREFQDGRLAHIDDPVQRQFRGAVHDPQTIAQAIRLAAAERGWKVETEAPGRAVLSTTVRTTHKAKVEVRYAPAGYSINYVDSSGLMYDDKAETYLKGAPARAIHRNYNVWVSQLAMAIDFSLASLQAGEAGLKGLPAVGMKWRYGMHDEKYGTGEQFFTVEVAAVDGATVHEIFAVEGGGTSRGAVDSRGLRFVAHSLPADRTLVEFAPYLGDLRSGAAASYPGSGFQQEWDIGAPRFTEEVVVVPAGRFSTVRIDVRGAAVDVRPRAQATVRFVFTAWYSPALNRYVQARHQIWNSYGTRISDERIRLFEYWPAK